MKARSATRTAYRAATGARLLSVLPSRQTSELAVCYGGARPGDAGGSLVKVRHLQRRFPEHWLRLSLLYMLSNAIYLPHWALRAAKTQGLPVVLNQNGVFYPGWFPHGWESENARMARLHALADHVFYQSEFCRLCAQRFLGARSGLGEVLYNAVDVARFTPGERKAGGDPFTFLVTGKIGAATAYRLTSSIDGLAQARKGGMDARLIVAGFVEPEVGAQARRQIERSGMDAFVVLAGAYRHQDAPEIYRAADAYLITKHNDPCPNVVLEAMACGLPVVYAASGGVPELVGADAGIGIPMPETFERDLVPEPDAIAEAMVQVIRQRESMGAAARARAVANFDIKKWLDRHASLFESLIQRPA